MTTLEENNSGSKAKLIEAAIELLSTKGFNGSGINEILETAKVTKSNFYYHFKSKEMLGLTALDLLIHKFNEAILKPTFLNQSLDPKKRLERFFQILVEMLDSNCCQWGCPFVNLASETSDLYPLFQHKMDQFFKNYKSAIQCWYQDGVNCGEFREDLSAEMISQLILSAINGSMVLVKTLKNAEVLKQNAKTLSYLLESKNKKNLIKK
ncbi:MAG: TetR/AcrR family transcriptional regulator [Planctomycetota bacterium]